MKEKIKFNIGSRYFFENLEGYVSKDKDILVIMDRWPIYKTKVLNLKDKEGNDIFFYKDMSKEDFIRDTISSNVPMRVGKFLIKEFNEYIGFTIEDLKRLESIFNKLDKKHEYEKYIYKYYIDNNSFSLSEKQLLKCYDIYKNNKE